MTAAGRARRSPRQHCCARRVPGAAPALALVLLAVATVAAGEGESVAASAGDGERAARRVARFDPGCQAHSQCAHGEFCQAELCGYAWDVRHPCGACRRCEECECDSQAVDHYCPESCGSRRLSVCAPRCCASRRQRAATCRGGVRAAPALKNPRAAHVTSAVGSRWVAGLEGLFYRVDAGGCVTAWIFEGGTFRVLRGHAPPDPIQHGPSGGECADGPSYETGAFRVDTSGGIPSLTLDFAWSSLQPKACARRSARLDRDCQNRLKLHWLERAGCTPLAPTILFRPGTAAHAGGGGGGNVALPGTSWKGTVAMHTTNCSLSMQWRAVAPDQGLFAWVADLFDCRVGPDRALEDPSQTRQASAAQGRQSRRLQQHSAANWTQHTHVSGAADGQVYTFDANQHLAYDIVHPNLCLNTRTFLLGDGSNVSHYGRNPEWHGLAKMPNGTTCSGHVPYCHNRSSCAVFFFSDGFRDPKNPDPAYDQYMRNCHPDGSVGIFDDGSKQSTVGRRWKEAGPSRPVTGTKIIHAGLEAAIEQKGIRIGSGELCELSPTEFDPTGVADLSLDSYVRVGRGYFKQAGEFGECSAILWNVTHECICNVGWIGDGRCCLDKQVRLACR